MSEPRKFHVFDCHKTELEGHPDAGWAYFHSYVGQKVLITDMKGDEFEFEYQGFVDASGEWGPFHRYYSEGRAKKLRDRDAKARAAIRAVYCAGKECCCGSTKEVV
jgi:hypothetical protein